MDTSRHKVTSQEDEEVVRLAERLLDTIPRALHAIRQSRSGPSGLTLAQFRVLLHIGRHPGIGLTGLAEHLNVRLSSTSALVDRLVKAGYVDRDIDPNERRRIRMHLTPTGAEQVAQAHDGTRTWLTDRLAALTPGERASLDAAMTTLDRTVGGS